MMIVRKSNHETTDSGSLVELKFTSRDGLITGYGSTFGGKPDSYGDIVAPGAFAQSLKDHAAAGSMPAMLWAHNPGEPIGKWVSAKEDSHGLALTGSLTLGVRRADEAYALARDGALGLSIGFRTVKADGSGPRTLREVKLAEVSLVGMPANTSARITSVKTAGFASVAEIKTSRDFEHFLRHAGFPKDFARAVTARGFKAVDEGDRKSIAALIRASAKQLETLNRKGN